MRAGLRSIRVRRDDPFAANQTLDAQDAHHPFHCASGNIFTLPAQNVSNLARTVELAVVRHGHQIEVGIDALCIRALMTGVVGPGSSVFMMPP